LTGKPSKSKTKFKKGMQPWNKGKTGYKINTIYKKGWHHSEDTKVKISEASKKYWEKWRQ
jgi:hypothetical protein